MVCSCLASGEGLLAERSMMVSYGNVRPWCRNSWPARARATKRRPGRLGDTRYADEVFVPINGQRRYLRCAPDQDGDILDILVQSP
jgi:putative transposase